jgi:3-methyladenine DNA glycosylase AlkD
MSLVDLRKELFKFKDSEQAKNLSRFFKTDKGDYGEGDKFLGIKMAPQRVIARKYKDLPLLSVQSLLDSKYHEERMLGLLILVYKYQDSDDKESICKFYLKNWKAINNWDLVDVTTPQIVGDYLLEKDKKVLYELAASKNIWKKRISILATFTFIRNDLYEDTLKISKILLNDSHDLIHKAVGWMLREVGNRDLIVEEKFLKKYYKKMPRTMLRYAIEKFPEEKRQAYLKGKI